MEWNRNWQKNRDILDQYHLCRYYIMGFMDYPGPISGCRCSPFACNGGGISSYTSGERIEQIYSAGDSDAYYLCPGLVALGALSYAIIFSLIQQVLTFQSTVVNFFNVLPQQFASVQKTLVDNGIPQSKYYRCT